MTRHPPAVRMVELARGRTVIWDFDGVLVDSEAAHRDSYVSVAFTRGVTLGRAEYRDLAGHPEERNWQLLIERGLQPGDDGIRALMRERATEFARAAEELSPSWLATRLMPALSGAAIRQLVISNNESALVRRLLAGWRVDEHAQVVQRTRGTDKGSLIRDHAGQPLLLVDDNPAYLALGRELGAVTVGVRHAENRHVLLKADLLLDLDASG